MDLALARGDLVDAAAAQKHLRELGWTVAPRTAALASARGRAGRAGCSS